MKLENIFREGKKHLKRTFISALVASSIFFSSCCVEPEIEIPPVPPIPPKENELYEHTEVLSTTNLNNISSVGTNSIIFSAPMDYSTGDIIVCDISDATPNGLLRKVTSVSYDKKTFYTKQATLEDAIKNADVTFTTKRSARATEIPTLKFKQEFDNMVLFDDDGNNLTTYDQITVMGELSGSLDLILDLKIAEGSFQEFIFKTSISQYSHLKLTKAWKVPDLEKEFSILEIPFHSFTIGYIPGTIFPIVVKPTLDIRMGVNGELPEEMCLSQRAELIAGLKYEKDSGWDIIKDVFWGGDCFPRVLEDIPDFKIFAGPKLNTLVYNMAGPYGEINAYVNKISTPSSWEVRVGSEVNLGARMRIFSWNIADYSANVIDDYTVIAEGEIEEPEPEPESLEKILFVSSGNPQYFEIYTINLDGSNQKNLTNNPGDYNSPSWSPDGTKIIFSLYIDSATHNDIYSMNPDGSNKTQLTNDDGYESSPIFSPDGNKIAYIEIIHDRQIYIMDRDGLNPLQITNFDYCSLLHISWSSSNKITFSSNKDNYYHEIYTMNANGSDLERLTNNSFRDYSPSWSPDGTKILFASERTGDREIYMMNADGSNPINISNSPNTYDSDPSWSPDATKVVYISRNNTEHIGYQRVWIMNADGSNKIQLNDSRSHSPVCSPVPIPK